MKKAEHKNLCLGKMKQNVYSTSHCNITWDGISCWDRAPVGQTVTRHCPDYVHGFNSANMMTRHCQEDGTWRPMSGSNNTHGWTNYTQCDKGGEPEMAHFERMKLMSEIGYGVSLAALTVAVIIMVGSKRLRCKSNSLHINLFLAFILRAVANFVKNKLFINDIGLAKDIRETENGTIVFIEEGTHWECKLITTVFMYALCASLMWIFMEGLYLHMLVYRTFFTERHGVWIYVILGWLSPLLYVVPWILARIFLYDEMCWTFHKENGLLWIVEGPLILTNVVNFIFFIDIVRVLCKRVKSHQNHQGSSKQFRKVAKFAVVLIPLFGVIYIITAAYPYRINQESDVVFLYFEMFYNSFQGFILALLFCFLNEEVQKECRRCWQRKTVDRLATSSILLSAIRRTKDSHLKFKNGTSGGSMHNIQISSTGRTVEKKGDRKSEEGVALTAKSSASVHS